MPLRAVRTMIIQTSNHVPAHIYEHAYCVLLGVHLRAMGFCSVVDFEIDAYTEDGVMHVTLESFIDTIDPQVILQEVLHKAISPELIRLARQQVEAEYGRIVVAEDNELQQAVQVLASAARAGKRCNVDAAGKTFQHSNDNTEIQAIYISLPYSVEHLPLLPLMRLVYGIALTNISDVLADTHGGFVNSPVFTAYDDGLYMQLRFTATSSLTDLQQTTNREVARLQQSGVWIRLIEMLSDIETMPFPPSNVVTHGAYRVVMDPQKWQHMATNKNLQMLLRLLKPELTYSSPSTGQIDTK